MWVGDRWSLVSFAEFVQFDPIAWRPLIFPKIPAVTSAFAGSNTRSRRRVVNSFSESNRAITPNTSFELLSFQGGSKLQWTSNKGSEDGQSPAFSFIRDFYQIFLKSLTN